MFELLRILVTSVPQISHLSAKITILEAPNRKPHLCYLQQLAGVVEERVAIVHGGYSSPERTHVQWTRMVRSPR